MMLWCHAVLFLLYLLNSGDKSISPMESCSLLMGMAGEQLPLSFDADRSPRRSSSRESGV